MRSAIVALAVAVMIINSGPLSASPPGIDSWQPFYEADSGIVYAFSSASLVRTGDRVDVWVRSKEGVATDNESVTLLRYNLNCRQGTFRVLEVVEERAGERSVCTTPTDELPINRQKHRQLEMLRARVCP